MKIKYSINKSYPDVQYIAKIVNLPMATFNPELTETKVTKERLQRKGMTIVEDKELEINIISLFWFLLVGHSIESIIKEKTGHEYTFNHKILQN